MNIDSFSNEQLIRLVDDRWKSSDDIWNVVREVYERTTRYYDSDLSGDRVPDYLLKIPVKQHRVRANRIFINTEAVINSVIANPPKPNIIPGRATAESQQLAQMQQEFFVDKYEKRDVRSVMRQGLRNLYFGRLIVLKPFWNAAINDVDVKAVDPRKVRISKRATNEPEAEFIIEEVDDTLASLVAKFPEKRDDILDKHGISKDMPEAEKEAEIALQNTELSYRETHIVDWVICTYQGIVLKKFKNPYWDWDGLKITEEEEKKLADPNLTPQDRKDMLNAARQRQESSGTEPTGDGESDKKSKKDSETDAERAYRFNHFDRPRKPYIFATILNNESGPIGRTSFIEQGISLQESIDRRKRQIDWNNETINGITKVDSTVMSKSDAQKLTYETGGVVWGKGVVAGVQRETGTALPVSAFNDMVDSRQELDNIMAATSAFRGEREGQETKAGRLALIEQSALRLNELVQVIDYLNTELFNWWYQLGKVFYTERHYSKILGPDNATKVIELTQDDFEDGAEVQVIPGKTLPEDQTFRYERAQNDMKGGFIAPVDYFREAGYNNPVETAKNAELYKVNPLKAVGVSDEELQEYIPPKEEAPPEQKPPSISLAVKYDELPPSGKMQAAALLGIKIDPSEIEDEHKLEVAPQLQDMALRQQEAQASQMQQPPVEQPVGITPM